MSVESAVRTVPLESASRSTHRHQSSRPCVEWSHGFCLKKKIGPSTRPVGPLRLKSLASHTAEVLQEKDCKNTSTSHRQTQETEPARATRRKRLHWLHGAQEEGAICNERPRTMSSSQNVASMSAVRLQAYAQSARPSIKGWRLTARASRASAGSHRECKCNESEEARLIFWKQLVTVTLRKRNTHDCSTTSVVCNRFPSEKERSLQDQPLHPNLRKTSPHHSFLIRGQRTICSQVRSSMRANAQA
mmetsp:Transcript_49390/g.131029  ORF Transcript_49390/g.131029 Transcript_49390/m.131029 type:complete len:246 (-) Transcript_49390:903-1640(-)